ncbi:hypothetical protein G7054_g6509 [Neopestalotiopsis clavispora]|nr:hypothetical protein G7054_g6509 [Neopestalotiopsis clavispora]
MQVKSFISVVLMTQVASASPQPGLWEELTSGFAHAKSDAAYSATAVRTAMESLESSASLARSSLSTQYTAFTVTASAALITEASSSYKSHLSALDASISSQSEMIIASVSQYLATASPTVSSTPTDNSAVRSSFQGRQWQRIVIVGGAGVLLAVL